MVVIVDDPGEGGIGHCPAFGTMRVMDADAEGIELSGCEAPHAASTRHSAEAAKTRAIN